MHSRYSPFVLLGFVCLACAEEPKPIDYSHAADFDYTGTLRVDEPVTFRSVSADAQGYEWDFGDGTAPGTGPQAVHTFARTGPFTVKLKASTAGGDIINPRKLTIVAQPIDYNSAADFTYSGVLKSGEPIAFSGTSSIAQSYQWDFGDGTTTGTGRSPVHTFRKGGTFPVTLTVSTANGPIGPIASTQRLTITQTDTTASYFAAVVGDYRLTQHYYRSTGSYATTTPCDIPVTASRTGDYLVVQQNGQGFLDPMRLGSASSAPGYHTFGYGDGYHRFGSARFKINGDSIILSTFFGSIGGSTENKWWGKRR